MTEKRLYFDIHAIQILPPSNINRDDTGSPKTCMYGGVRRARVSSQSWKRAIRQYFAENSQANVGKRTKDILGYIADFIQEKDVSIDHNTALEMAKKTIEASKSIKLDKDNKTKALFFIGKKQAERLAEASISGEKDPNTIKDILKMNPEIDIALFGRMVADDPSLNEDASAQVAHAISTHAVQNEFDYFTAIDDLAPEDNAGAGMLGTVEYNSSTLYRYANVAVHELYKQLNNDADTTINALKLFIEAFSNSLPTGKVNTFANQTIPQAIIINLRDDRPVSLVESFETPVKVQKGGGYADASIENLFTELKETEKFVDKPLFTLYLTRKDNNSFSNAGVCEATLKALLNDFADRVSAYIN
ncbi:MAG: type I-E CRISPR-associated protein Cas7/Cse4/CasC [Lachnospiraceae bacterium]|nr:type I-E CRISPR-associated protein Cas7/Cse4/CasC [Lachnospiraceae bacterium]